MWLSVGVRGAVLRAPVGIAPAAQCSGQELVVWWLVRVAGVCGRAGGGCGLCGILWLDGSNLLGMLAGYSCGWAACGGPCEMGCAVSLAQGMRVVSSVPFLAGI